MERMFFLELVPHETSPPVEEFMVQLRRLLGKLGKLQSFAMREKETLFEVCLCSKFSQHDLVEAFRGMMVKVRVHEKEGASHDCQTVAP